VTSAVIDASVWVAAVDIQDPSHASAQACLQSLVRHDVVVIVPVHARVEVACALARRFDAGLAQQLTETMFGAAFLREVPITGAFAREALILGTASRLRAADALYAALARSEDAVLITLDRELLERADGVIPADWLRTMT
jgi:predicted nucleic acid-binding protein